MEDKFKISIVCCMFNEAGVVAMFISEIEQVLTPLSNSYEIICVNDGSIDSTLQQLKSCKENSPQVRILNLSRNFGKEAALTAGLDHATGDVIIPIDADLQEPPRLIPQLIAEWKKGFDVVLAKRSDRSADSKLKSLTARVFYKLFNLVSETKIPENVGDFRLISRKVLNAVKALPENQRFMKGMFAWVGFKTTTVDFARDKRVGGKSKFTPFKLICLALSGLTSYSVSLLRLLLYIGIGMFLFSVIYSAFLLYNKVFLGVPVPGYTSLMMVVLFIGGVQTTALSILGEYLWRTYMESKRRPVYVLDDEH